MLLLRAQTGESGRSEKETNQSGGTERSGNNERGLFHKGLSNRANDKVSCLNLPIFFVKLMALVFVSVAALTIQIIRASAAAGNWGLPETSLLRFFFGGACPVWIVLVERRKLLGL